MSWLKDKVGYFLGGKSSASDAKALQVETSAASRFNPYLELNYLPLAQRMIERHLVTHDADLEVWCQLAQARWRVGDVAATGAALKRCLAKSVSHGTVGSAVLAMLREMDASTLNHISLIVESDQAAASNYQKLLARQKMQTHGEPSAVIEDELVVAKDILVAGVATRETYLLLSRLSAQQGNSTAAVAYLQDGVRFYSSDTTLYHELGAMLREVGRQSEATSAFELAVLNAPATELAHYQLGEQHLAAQKLDDAAAEFAYALNVNPLFAEAQARLADVALMQHHFDAAASGYCSALDLGSAPEWAITGAANLQNCDRSRDAVKIYRKLLARGFVGANILSDFGLALRQLGEIGEAREHLETALRLDPTHLAARHNFSMVLGDIGQGQQAIKIFSELLALHPSDVDIQVARAVERLLALDLAGGWDDYEARHKRADCRRPFTFPQWDGMSCRGKTLLIYGEQGVGDEIMFASCFADVLARADNVIIECDRRLAPLFARSFPAAKVQARVSSQDVTWLREAGTINVQCASGSLPRLFRRSVAEFPAHAGYLRADDAKVAKWRARLAQLPGKIKIGLSWRGGADRTRRNLRSIDLIQLAPLFRLTDVTFVNLQYDDVAEECDVASAVFGRPIVQFPEAIADYDETAALVCALDLVVSVQTAIVHLTGALGKRALVMLPFSPEWRYMRSGDRMLWYPSVKLFRQEKPKDWGPVIEKIAHEVATSIDARKI